jgi:hypothetical protein
LGKATLDRSVDFSDFANRVENPEPRHVTPDEARPTWPGAGAHSAIKLWGKDWMYVSDEVYGEAARALGPHGCPWGWARMVDIADPPAPSVEAEYRIEENAEDYALRYTGPFEDEVAGIAFLEGNSNLGDALCFEPVSNPDPDEELFIPAHC